MSQEQPRREDCQEEGINMKVEMKSKPVDAAMMHKVETATTGGTQKGAAAAAVMQSAANAMQTAATAIQSTATKNEKGGVSNVAVGVKEIDPSRSQVISESIGGRVVPKLNEKEKEKKVNKLVEVVEQFNQKASLNTATPPSIVHDMGGGGGSCSGITIGEALEATVLTAGKKAVGWSDAAAIQAAEVRATGRTNIVPGGVAAAAQSAATLNARVGKDEEKTKLADILTNATSKLPSDRAATRRDAEGVTGAEMRNDPNLTTHPGGVSASVAAAARLNQSNTN